MDIQKEKIKALLQHLDCKKSDINVSSYDDNVFEYGKQEYLVVTDEEANKLWDEDLDYYIDECILPELPESARQYFDDEKWKQDARYDGRGHSLSRYDGNEDEIKINGIVYFIYRQN